MVGNEYGTVGDGAVTSADRSVAIRDGRGHSIAVEDDYGTVLGWLGTVGDNSEMVGNGSGAVGNDSWMVGNGENCANFG